MRSLSICLSVGLSLSSLMSTRMPGEYKVRGTAILLLACIASTVCRLDRAWFACSRVHPHDGVCCCCEFGHGHGHGHGHGYLYLDRNRKSEDKIPSSTGSPHILM